MLKFCMIFHYQCNYSKLTFPPHPSIVLHTISVLMLIGFFFQSSWNQEGILMTQYPLPNTIADFWTMVYSYKSPTIVLLDDSTVSHVRKTSQIVDDVHCITQWAAAAGNFSVNIYLKCPEKKIDFSMILRIWT